MSLIGVLRLSQKWATSLPWRCFDTSSMAAEHVPNHPPSPWQRQKWNRGSIYTHCRFLHASSLCYWKLHKAKPWKYRYNMLSHGLDHVKSCLPLKDNFWHESFYKLQANFRKISKYNDISETTDLYQKCQTGTWMQIQEFYEGPSVLIWLPCYHNITAQEPLTNAVRSRQFKLWQICFDFKTIDKMITSKLDINWNA